MNFLDYEPRSQLSVEAQRYHDRTVVAGQGTSGIVYRYGEHSLNRLTVFHANCPTGDVLVAMHGGRWVSGYMEWMSMMAPPLNRKGISFVSLGFRLLSDAAFPAGLVDCAMGLRWVADHPEHVGLRDNRLYVGGHSSGAHYAALLAVNPSLIDGVSVPDVAGCLAISGVFDFVEGREEARPFRPDVDRETLQRYSPVQNVTQSSPPFLIAYGDRDIPRVQADSIAMVNALNASNVATKVLVIEGADHFDAHLACAAQEGAWIGAVEQFIQPSAA